MKSLKNVQENMHKVYEENAKAFDEQRSKNLFEKKWLVNFCQALKTGGTVLDVGCGSGDPIGKFIIENGFDLIGVDFSEKMINLAKDRFPKNLWLVRDMRELSLNQSFDGLIAWNSFFHLNQEEQRKVIPKFCELINENGIIMITVGPEAGEVLGKVNNCDVYHSSLSESEYREIFSKMNFKVIEFVPNDSECNGHSILLAQKSSGENDG